MAKYCIYDIDWDASQEDIEENQLPNEVEVEVNDCVDETAYIDEYISSEYGYLMNGYSISIIEL